MTVDTTMIDPSTPAGTRTAASPLMFDPLRFSKPVVVPPAERNRLIAEAAYYRAQKRGFLPGHEIEDWLAAEAEVAAQLYRAEAGQGPAVGK